MDSREPPILTMVVGANVRSWRGNGLLIIRQGVLTFESGRIMRRLTSVARVVQTSPKVTILYPKLAPPWINTHVVIEGADETIVAGTWGLARRRLRRALQTAGFHIVEVHPLLSWGGDRIRHP